MEQIELKQNTEIIKRNVIHDTPFTIITTDEGSFIAMGRYRVSDLMSEDQCLERILAKDWNLLISAIGIITETIKSNQP